MKIVREVEGEEIMATGNPERSLQVSSEFRFQNSHLKPQKAKSLSKSVELIQNCRHPLDSE